jgi:hypothetical protein
VSVYPVSRLDFNQGSPDIEAWVPPAEPRCSVSMFATETEIFERWLRQVFWNGLQDKKGISRPTGILFRGENKLLQWYIHIQRTEVNRC